MIYIIGMACMTGTLSAQTVVDYSTFEQKVLDYSQTLKQSVAHKKLSIFGARSYVKDDLYCAKSQ